MKKITVALTVKNVARDIRGVIECLLNQDCPKEIYEILVIDTGSTDDTIPILDQYQSKIRVIKTQATAGKGRFLAFKHARGEIVAQTDGDVYVPKDFVSKILKTFQKDESIVCVRWPSLTYPDKGFFYKCMTALWDGLGATSPLSGKGELWPGYKATKYKR